MTQIRIIRYAAWLMLACIIAAALPMLAGAGAMPSERDPAFRRLTDIPGIGLTVKSVSCPFSQEVSDQITAAGFDPGNFLCWVPDPVSGAVTPTGMAVTATLGTPVLSGSRSETLAPTGMYITASLGTPIVSGGVVGTVTPDGMSIVTALGTATITGTASATVQPTGLYVTTALGTPVISGTASGTVVPTGMAMAAALGTATVENIAPSLIYNSGFESAIGSGGGDNWWPGGGTTDNGTVTAERYSSGVMSGSYVGRLYAHTPWVDEEGYEAYGDAVTQMNTRIPAAKLDTTPTMTFDRRYTGLPFFSYVDIRAYDSGFSNITDATEAENRVALSGTLTGGSAIDTSITVATPNLNQTYSASFDVKTFISNHLTAGKTWADVAFVYIYFTIYVVAPNDDEGEMYIDNFN